MRLLELAQEITAELSRIEDPATRRTFEQMILKDRRDVAIMNGRLDMGWPSIDANQPNGQPGNILGSYVTEVFAVGELNAARAFVHNLNIPVVGTNIVNVMWWPVCIRIGSATVPGAATTTTFDFVDGDIVTADSIELRCHSGLTLGASPQVITVTMRFMPAEEGAL